MIYRVCITMHYTPEQIYRMKETDFYGLIEDYNDYIHGDKNKKPKQYQIDMIEQVRKDYERHKL